MPKHYGDKMMGGMKSDMGNKGGDMKMGGMMSGAPDGSRYSTPMGMKTGPIESNKGGMYTQPSEMMMRNKG